MPELHSLYRRLLVAEELGVQVRNDLSIIMEHLVNKSKGENATFSYVNATETIPQGRYKDPALWLVDVRQSREKKLQ